MALQNLSIEEKKDNKDVKKSDKTSKEFADLNKIAQKLRNQDEVFFITKWSESDLKKTEV